MSNQKPIILSTEMVRAILAGRKTQTRRIIKVQPTEPDLKIWRVADTTGRKKDVGILLWGKMVDFNLITDWNYFKCPYQIGDILWVRETWTSDLVSDGEGEALINYKADIPELSGAWKPSIHMPKDAARIFLKVTGVRAERLQNISEQDAIAEGIEKVGGTYSINPWRNYLRGKNGEMNMHCSSPIRSFQTLWDLIHGSEAWSENPWVWVIEFEVAEVKS